MAYTHIKVPTDNKAPYEKFYNNFLTRLNSLPMNSLWGLWIHDIPIPYIKETIYDVENWQDLASSYSLDFAHDNIDSTQTTNGLLIAQGVKTLGETLNVERVGIKNTGYIRGLINQGRSDFPLLNVEFVENNLSFVDFVLRPWIVAVGHNSLKDAFLKTDITVIFYSKMGAGENLSTRKTIKYEGCCPVGLDELESNYTGADMLRLRSVQFAFSKYTIMPADKALEGMFSGNPISEPVATKKIERWIADSNYQALDYPQADPTTGYDYAENAKGLDARQTGAPTPTYTPNGADANRAGYLNRLITDAGEFAADLVSGAVAGVVNNVTSTVTNRIDQVIHQTESRIQASVNDFVNKSGDALGRLIGEAGSVDSSVSNRLASVVLKNVNADDTPTFPTPDIKQDLGKPAIVDTRKVISLKDVRATNESVDYVNVSTDPNDVRLNQINHQDVIKNVDPNDVRLNQINHQDVIKNVDPNDYISDKTRIAYKVVLTDQNDTRKTNEPVDFVNIQTDPNDTRKTNEPVDFVNIQTDPNDFITKNTVVNYVKKETDPNDFITKNTVVNYVKKETDPNDTITPNDIKYIVKPIKSNDHI